MVQDTQTKHSIDQETPMYKPEHAQERSSKCFVFILASFVTLCAVLLAFASIFLRVRSPEFQLRSATVNHISYSASPSASFNITMITHLCVRNPNYGGFSYENIILSVLYDGVRVGDREIGSDRVKARDTKGMNVTMNMSSGKRLVMDGNLSSEISSGMLNLTSYAKFSGKVKLLKIINKRKTIEMVCTMNLNLTSHAVHNIQC